MLLAILFNIDSIHLFRALWQHPAVAAQLVAAPSSVDQQTIDALFSLPIGWTTFPPVLNHDFALQVAGWMLTASTALFGAPFWFDLLQRTMQLRGTGASRTRRRQVKVEVSAAASGAGGRCASISMLETETCGIRSGHASPGPNQRASAISVPSTRISPSR